MDTVNVITIGASLLIELPVEYRNKNWSESFGSLQYKLRNLGTEIKEVRINASQCVWADPLPLLSLAIAIGEINDSGIVKKIYLPDLYLLDNNQKRFLAFIEKEGFLDCFITFNTEVLVPSKLDKNFKCIDKEYRDSIRNFDKYLCFPDCSILKAKVINLSDLPKNIDIEKYIDVELSEVRHRFKSKMLGTIEKETFNKVALFLKETIENVFEHAYDDKKNTLVGYYIRSRVGMADNSLADNSRYELIKVIKSEHYNCPKLSKSFLENISSFIEIFVIDSGVGLTNKYFDDNRKKIFHEAWRDAVGSGIRVGNNYNKKNTKFGGLYTLSKLCSNNYLAATDHTEWIGDLLPVKGRNPKYSPNNWWLNICTEKQIEGLALIARISWKTAKDDDNLWVRLMGVDDYNSSNIKLNPYICAINEKKDIYIKYYSKSFGELAKKPIYILDERFDIKDKCLNEEYFGKNGSVEYCLYLPSERLTKNKIFDIVCNSLGKVIIKNKSIIIADIEVWEANLYQLALENATYPIDFLGKINRILLITRRMSTYILIKKNGTFVFDKNASIEFIKNRQENFNPAHSFLHLVELLRTHDSMIYWQHIKSINLYGEYFLNKKIIWFQEEKDIGLNGYLNFSQTLTESYCKKIYKYSLERTLCLSNADGCRYRSIDILTSNLADQYNSLFYNKNEDQSQVVLLGSVFVSGYSERVSDIEFSAKRSNVKIHFFYNQGIENNPHNKQVSQLLLWPSKGQSWLKGNLDEQSYITGFDQLMRVGTSYAIAPHGWKYFPIPRYKLYDKKNKAILNNYSIDEANNCDFEFKSIYKSTPVETYMDWQGKRSQVMSLGHFCYESYHDLFKIDIPFFVNESFLIGGKLSQFLVAEFLNALGVDENSIHEYENDMLISGVKRYLENEYTTGAINDFKSAVIVYPYHYNTDYVVSMIKDKIEEDLHNRIIPLFPLNKIRVESIFFISPLTMEVIKKKIKEYKSVNKNQNVNVLLFDDATITGNVRKEIKHILFGLGADSVTTLTIIERRRLPFDTSDFRYNKAYWRLDINKLGSSDKCPICVALLRISNIRNHIASHNILNRINEIKDIWRENTPYKVSDTIVVSPTNIDLTGGKLLKKYGIYFDGNEFQQCGGDINKIELSNSLGLTVYVSEVFAMSSRDDIVFKFLLNKEISAYAKIEMLSVYLILFGKELSGITRKRIIVELFLLCENIVHNNHTSFALISMMCQPADILECLYDIKDSGEMDIKIDNLDMQVLCSTLSLNQDSQFSTLKSLKRLRKGYKNLRDLYKQFHSEIYNDYGIIHDTPISIIIKKDSLNLNAFRKLEDSLDKISYCLDKIPKWYYRKDSASNCLHTESIKVIKNLIVKYKNISNALVNLIDEPVIDTLTDLATLILEELKALHDKLFIRADNLIIESSISQLISLSKKDIDFSCNYKKAKQICDPQIKRWIAWDIEVVTKMSYLLDNVRHASEDVVDPFNIDATPKNAWVDIEYFENDNFIQIYIYNLPDKNSIEVKENAFKKQKQQKAHLCELEIDIDYDNIIIDNTKYLRTKITFPYL